MKYIREFGTLFSEFYENHRLLSLMYYPILSMRALIFSINQLFLSHFEYLQKSVNLAASAFLFFYLLAVKPFKVKEILISNIFSEFTNISIFVIIVLRDYMFQSGLDEYFDKIFIGLVYSQIAFQYLVIFLILCQKLRHIYHQYRNSRHINPESKSAII